MPLVGVGGTLRAACLHCWGLDIRSFRPARHSDLLRAAVPRCQPSCKAWPARSRGRPGWAAGALRGYLRAAFLPLMPRSILDHHRPIGGRAPTSASMRKNTHPRPGWGCARLTARQRLSRAPWRSWPQTSRSGYLGRRASRASGKRDHCLLRLHGDRLGGSPWLRCSPGYWRSIGESPPEPPLSSTLRRGLIAREFSEIDRCWEGTGRLPGPASCHGAASAVIRWLAHPSACSDDRGALRVLRIR